MIRFRVRGGRNTSPAGATAGGSRPARPAYPAMSTVNPDCACGQHGDVVSDGETLCVGCFLDRIRPFRRHHRWRIW